MLWTRQSSHIPQHKNVKHALQRQINRNNHHRRVLLTQGEAALPSNISKYTTDGSDQLQIS